MFWYIQNFKIFGTIFLPCKNKYLFNCYYIIIYNKGFQGIFAIFARRDQQRIDVRVQRIQQIENIHVTLYELTEILIARSKLDIQKPRRIFSTMHRFTLTEIDRNLSEAQFIRHFAQSSFVFLYKMPFTIMYYFRITVPGHQYSWQFFRNCIII